MAIPCGSFNSGAPITAATRGCRRLVEVYDHQAAVAQNVSVRAGDSDASCAVQDSLGIECESAFQKIISWIAIQERAYTGGFAFWVRVSDDHQAFILVRDVQVSVNRVNRLLFVFRAARASRINRQRGGARYRHGVFCLHVKLLAQRRNGRGDCAFGETLVVDVGYVVSPETSLPQSGVQIFPAKLDVKNVSEVMISFLQLPVACDVLAKIFRVRKTLQVTADDRGRLIVFGHGDRIETFGAVSHINVAAHEVQKVSSLQQDLRHPRVVVIAVGNVAIVASLRFLSLERCAGRTC